MSECITGAELPRRRLSYNLTVNLFLKRLVHFLFFSFVLIGRQSEVDYSSVGHEFHEGFTSWKLC